MSSNLSMPMYMFSNLVPWLMTFIQGQEIKMSFCLRQRSLGVKFKMGTAALTDVAFPVRAMPPW